MLIYFFVVRAGSLSPRSGPEKKISKPRRRVAQIHRLRRRRSSYPFGPSQETDHFVRLEGSRAHSRRLAAPRLRGQGISFLPDERDLSAEFEDAERLLSSTWSAPAVSRPVDEFELNEDPDVDPHRLESGGFVACPGRT
jgi:hypothetical protein